MCSTCPADMDRFEVLLGSCRLPSGFYSVPALVFDVKLWQEMQFLPSTYSEIETGA